MSGVLPGVPRASLASGKAIGAVGKEEGHRMCPGGQGLGVGQLSWEGGHSPVLPISVDCVWARGVCWSCGERLTTRRRRRRRWKGLGSRVSLGGAESRGWGQAGRSALVKTEPEKWNSAGVPILIFLNALISLSSIYSSEKQWSYLNPNLQECEEAQC